MHDGLLAVMTPWLLAASSLGDSLGRTPAREWRQQRPDGTLCEQLHNERPWQVFLVPQAEQRPAS
jgi:hypothetical protein